MKDRKQTDVLPVLTSSVSFTAMEIALETKTMLYKTLFSVIHL